MMTQMIQATQTNQAKLVRKLRKRTIMKDLIKVSN